jgi:DNA-binding transcriptional MocR family regulator
MTIDFAVGRTNPEDFPVEAFKAAAARAIDNEFEALTNYHIGLGHPRLREILAARESDREGVTVDPDHLALMMMPLVAPMIRSVETRLSRQKRITTAQISEG